VKRALLLGGLVALVAAAAVGAYSVLHEDRPSEKRGSAREEFTPTEPKPRPVVEREPWPTYGLDAQRSHLAEAFHHKPPYRLAWSLDAGDTLEFPPSVGYGRVYIAQQKGRFFAIDARSGRVRWRKATQRCAASSPALSHGVVYQGYMDFVPCPQGNTGASGFLVAWNARTGRRKWIFRAAPVESSPLVARGRVYFGAWDHNVYALDARTGRKRWSFQADDQVNTSAAYSNGKVFIASDGGTLYALDARSGRLRWQARPSAAEFFYATPTVAYGRVFIGNTNGGMYAYGARSGRLLWSRPLGSYVYSGAAVWRRRVFVGTYDGKLYALNAATGDTIWQKSTAASVHSAPTVMDGLVYYATCADCGRAASRSVKSGDSGTWAVSARTGRLRWHAASGKFASPIVADRERVYLTGRVKLFALVDRKPGHRR
jgi:outer membrane protein assembly factor BamB